MKTKNMITILMALGVSFGLFACNKQINNQSSSPTNSSSGNLIENTFEVKFFNGDEEIFKLELMENAIPVYLQENPSLESTAQYTYEFLGWATSPEGEVVDSFAPVTEDINYYAIYSSTVNVYTVKFVDENGTELQSEELEYGSTPEFKSSTPTKADDLQYKYSFTGWDKEITSVVSNVTYTATYSKTIQKYTVTWDVDGNVQTQSFDYGTIPSYTGNLDKEATSEHSFEFKGWDKELSTVVGDVTYTAVFEQKVRKYEIKFVNEFGETLQSEEVEYGILPVYKGEEPTKQATSQYTFSFTGWDKTIETVTGAATYTAEFSSKINEYTVTFFDEDGVTVLETYTVKYGQMAEYIGAPNKESTIDKVYTFTGWDRELENVVGNTSYIAVYQISNRTYEVLVSYVDEQGNPFEIDGKTSNSYVVEYGHKFNKANSLLPKKEGYVANTFWLDFDINEYYYADLISLNKIEKKVVYGVASVWDGTTVSASLTGSGTQDNPFLISSAADLAYLSSITQGSKPAQAETFCTGQYYKLTTNIDLNNYSWKPIGFNGGGNTTWDYFDGVFDGNGKVISGLYYNDTKQGIGLFSAISNKISNFVVEGSLTAESRAAGAVFITKLDAVTIIENITSYVDVTAGTMSAGVVGHAQKKAQLKNLVNYGSVTGNAVQIAGIVGAAQISTIIEDSVNYGAISNSNNQTGGLVGALRGTLKNSKNYGNVSVSGSGVAAAGGAGLVTAEGKISGVINYGDIIASNTVGGIAGNIDGSLIARTGEDYHFINCTNYGDINAKDGTAGGVLGYTALSIGTGLTNYGDVSAPKFIGGVIGNADIANTTYSDLHNHGNVSGGIESTDVLGVGGIIGNSRATLSDVHNTGNVKGLLNNINVGGIAGTTSGGSITNASNSGLIEGFTYVGGIVGKAAGSIDEAINNGEVIGDKSVGGIVGYTGANVTESINNGTVKGTYRVGGIVGTLCGSVVDNCINNGNVSTLELTKDQYDIGGIAGGNTKTANGVVGTISNCTNKGVITGNNSVGTITGFNGPNCVVTNCVSEGSIVAELEDAVNIGGEIGFQKTE